MLVAKASVFMSASELALFMKMRRTMVIITTLDWELGHAAEEFRSWNLGHTRCGRRMRL